MSGGLKLKKEDKEAGEPTETPAGTPNAPTTRPTPALTTGNTISNTNGTSNGSVAPGAVEMKVLVEDKPLSGADIRLKLVVRSLSGAPCSLLLHINVQAMKYTGTPASQVQTEEKQLQLAPGQGTRTALPRCLCITLPHCLCLTLPLYYIVPLFLTLTRSLCKKLAI